MASQLQKGSADMQGGWGGSDGGGPAGPKEIPASGSLFAFSSAFVKCLRVWPKHQESIESTICS